mgnify:CR=1 FL=1
MARIPPKKFSTKEANYWSNVCITSSQVFLGIAAVTFFAGVFDISKLIVIVLNSILALILWMVGWRIIK